ncbi:MAG: N-acetylglucosamine-6-phosphate deacetylase [Dehalococcoidia bacterium]
MTTLAICNGTVYTPFDVIEDGAVLVRDGVIEAVGPRAQVPVDSADERIDCGGRNICPGFIDLQVNGGGGVLLTEQGDVDAVDRMARAHARFGTTAMLPTVVTSREDVMVRGLEAVRDAMQRPPASARILGAHLEGPFINPARKGAHNERFIREPDAALFERLLAARSLRLITLAPELAGALDLVRAARAANVTVSIGHSDATYDEARAAIHAGASFATHLFNAMRPLQQREPGVIGALLASDDIVAGMIADAVHVHPALLGVAARAKGANRIALVTDAMPPAGAEGASFSLYGGDIVVRDGACYTPEGVLAGSALTMDRAVRNMRRLAGVPLRECIEMATATPARVLGLEGELGVLAPGARADIVVCDDDVNVWRVFVGGVLVQG